MQRRHLNRLFSFVLALTLLASPALGAAAQTPQPPVGDRPTAPSPLSTLALEPEGSRPWMQRPAAGAPDAATVPAIPIGQPGLSFRYVQTFGTTGMPYFDDTSHLNYPWGVGAAGNAVWIGEHFGMRALKFTSDGAFVSSIGQVGNSDFDDYYIGEVFDVAVDGGGNTWLANGNQALKFDSGGAYVSTLGEGLGAGNQQFQYAVSVAFDSAGNIYVSDGTSWWGSSDTGNHRIQVFDSSGTYRATIGATGVAGTANNRFHGPRHIAIYGNTLYVADSGNHRVQLFDIANPMAPAYLATIGVPGQAGDDNGHLGSPSGVAVNAGFIYIADTWNDRVQVFDRATRSYVATIGGVQGAGNNQFHRPSDVAVDAAGNIYVADFVNTRVQQFNSSRVYVRTYGATGVPYLTDGFHYNMPSGVAAAADGGFYITEDNGHRLIKLDAAGQLQWTVGAAGVKGDWNDANDRLNNPADVAVDAAGRVLVTDRWNGRVQIFNADGSYYGTMAQPVSGGRGFNCPGGVGVAPNGDITVADTCAHVVDIFNRHWLHLATLGTVDQAGTDNAHFDGPEDVAVDSRGFIYVADNNNHRVQVFDANRAYMRTIGVTGQNGSDFDHLGGPNGLFVDGADRLYVADSWNNRIQVFDANGAYLATIGGSWGVRSGQFKSPSGVAVAANGDVFVADTYNHRVQKFSAGVPGWVQTNVNGFGIRRATWISSVLPFRGALYAAGGPPRVWRMTPTSAWSQVSDDGFGDDTNVEIDAMAEFAGYLYATTFTWVCDDPNCNTGHPNGPQVYRSADGSTWQLAAPAGSFGNDSLWIAGLAVFNGYLYAGAGGNGTHGGEIWRTADGLAWTRVVANGFDDDIYNTDVLSLAVHGGQLYAGTRHGDWIDDGHPNGPLGSEVWRSSDGVHWSQINAPGFGMLEAHRVETLIVFQNGLYAYASHVGGSAAGADVWRCTASVCSGQADWTKVVNNGFGVPENQYLYAGAAAGGYLYGVVRNDTTGPQIFRSADGVAWSKATPYDGLGDSTNVYVFSHAMAVFGDRLFLGVSNGAKGAGVWKKTVTADFNATPTTGRPPLAVSFSNASAGDVTSTLWDFGDGQTSTVANPTHTYSATGAYTVRLTVSDGVDSHTLTRPGYVNAWYRTFLPISVKGYDPTIYDSFDNPACDGVFNPLLWSPSSPNTSVQFRQQAGALKVTNTPSANPSGESLIINRPLFRSWQHLQQIEARLKVSSDRSGGWSPVQLTSWTEDANGHAWFASCTLTGSTNSSRASFYCTIFIRQGNSYPNEYSTPGMSVDYDSWHTARIETNPNTANVRFYLDNTLIGSHTPSDAAALLSNNQMQMGITVWGGDPNSSATRYVDDVRITPAR